MLRKLVLGLVIIAGVATPSSSHAYDRWQVDRFKTKVKELFCAGGADWLRCYQEESYNCREKVSLFVDYCVESALLSSPALQFPEQKLAVAQQIDSCFRSKFMDVYAPRLLKTEACRDPFSGF